MVVPTLAADERIRGCLAALRGQTWTDFEVIVVDSSGTGKMRTQGALTSERLVETAGRARFAEAANAGIRQAYSPLVALLNDDAYPEPSWLAALAQAAVEEPAVGMFASRVVLTKDGLLDSAGMLLCADGSSKQRGHGRAVEEFSRQVEVLLPSASAALYRRRMLDETGLFDEGFGMYCEDTDLGLRGRWAGWRCIYVPQAVVRHDYSATAGRASRLKAYLVERNRLQLVVKNFPLGMMARVPLAAVARYFWHVREAIRGRGAAADFVRSGEPAWGLAWLVVRAHCACLARLPRLLRLRWQGRRRARITAAEFRAMARQHIIEAREVARL